MNNHDWPRATKILREILEDSGLFAVDVSTSPPANALKEARDQWRPQFAKYRAVLSNFNGGHTAKGVHWPKEVEKSLEDYVGGGAGSAATAMGVVASRNPRAKKRGTMLLPRLDCLDSIKARLGPVE